MTGQRLCSLLTCAAFGYAPLGCAAPRQQPADLTVQTSGVAARLRMFAALTPEDERNAPEDAEPLPEEEDDQNAPEDAPNRASEALDADGVREAD